MRPLLHGDVSAAARALYLLPDAERRRACARMIAQAEAADRYSRRHARVHPRFGNGSLMGAARKYKLAPEPGFDDADYCRCFALVLQAVAELPQPEAQPTQRVAARSSSSRRVGMSSPHSSHQP